MHRYPKINPKKTCTPMISYIVISYQDIICPVH